MKTPSFFLVLTAFIFTLTNLAFAQKKVVAVMPFLSANAENKQAAAALQSVTLQLLNNNTSITIVDRSADPMVLSELNNQIREQSMMSKTLVQQGKLSGSEQIIVGTLNNVSIESKGDKYSASLNYTLQIIDAATGTSISSKSFSGSTGTQDVSNNVLKKTSGLLGGLGGVLKDASEVVMSDTKEAAISNAITNSKSQIAFWINSAYPAQLVIISVDDRDGSGVPITVTIGGFPNDGSTYKSVLINEISYAEAGGRKFKKVAKIAELKVAGVQGEVGSAKVKSGGKELDEKIKSKAVLEFILN